MARTAPVPNIPAIPGMNPGIFVLGGGGDGGGSGEGGGDGKGGKQGAGGKNGGKGANGGGKGADGCGPGSGQGCSNPQHGNGGGTAAGDPVDIVTGRVYTLAETDLALNGVIPLLIKRSYSTVCAERDVGLGFGWSCSLSWEVVETRRTVTVWKPDGGYIRATKPAVGEQVTVEEGVFLSRQAYGYTLATDDGLVHVFVTQEAIEGRIPLSRILDRAGNAIELKYKDGLLDTITDSVGRPLRVRRYSDGRISAFEVKNAETLGSWVAFRRYEYDDQGDLVATVDPYGFRTRFTYAEHRMTSRTAPSGLKVSFVYDGAFRCVETWTEQPGVDPALDADAPATLADGVTPARGMLHCKITYGQDGFREVIDSRQVRRYEGNEHGKVDKASWASGVHACTYDEAGNMTGYADALDARWVWRRDAEGRVIEKIDPLGSTSRFEYDAEGRQIAATDPLGSSARYAHDKCGHLLRAEDEAGILAAYKYDERGQLVEMMLPNGGISRIVRDAHNNRTEVHEPNGAIRRIAYNYLGRATSMRDERGGDTHYVYDDRGKLAAIRSPKGGVHRFEHDSDGRLCRVTNADGRSVELVWGGCDVVCEIRRADGGSIRLRYDREGELVRVIDEGGDEHHLERDTGGRVVGERTFDGRTIRYKMDPNGRLVLIQDGRGEKTELTYDEAGRLVLRTFPDGRTESFEYDALGRVIAARNEASEVTFQYDARGRKISEAITVDGVTRKIDSGFDATGKRTSMKTSLGFVQQIARDVIGAPTAVVLGDRERIELLGDAIGSNVRCKLPKGGEIRYERDITGHVLRRVVLRTTGAAPAPIGEPEWVGAQRLGAVNDRAYAYSLAGVLTEETDSARGLALYEHDPIGQILGKITKDQVGARFHYDAVGNLHSASGPARQYGAGGKLLAMNGNAYAYDADGRLVEKRVSRSDGGTDLWSYSWGEDGMLERVKRPDGTEVRFAYDPFGRRVRKEALGPDGARVVTRFVWDSDMLVHEIREASAGGGDPVVEERTYAPRPSSLSPLAHRDVRVRGEEREVGEWVHYVLDGLDRPDLLVNGAGELLSDLRPTVWGNVDPTAGAGDNASTPLRYPGQYADDETGLSYNRYRYYDPETGRYISPDPIGLEGGLRAFAYVSNSPLLAVDPTGLVQSVITGSAGTATGGSTNGANADYPHQQYNDLHPIVQQAMPPNMHPNANPGDIPGQQGSRLFPAGSRPPDSCAEPTAMSNYIRQWEQQNNGGRQLNPNDPRDHARIRECMGSINNVRSNEANGGPARRPCPNCSQMLANLNTRWGGPPTDNYGITPGAGTQNETQRRTNWSRPNQEWLGAAQDNPTPNFTPHVGYGQPAG